MKYMLAAAVCLLASFGAMGQEPEKEHASHGDFERHFHSISLAIGHTHIPKGFNGVDGRKGLIVPSWGLNYEYHFNEKWVIGWHNDMEISTYVVEGEHGDEIERERQLTSSIVGIFRPGKHVGCLAGFGREFERHQGFWVFRAGIEVEFEIAHSWSLIPYASFDLKETVYDAISIGLATSKRF